MYKDFEDNTIVSCSTQLFNAGDPNSSWIPSSSLYKQNADVSAFSLAQGSMGYFSECDDPWFSVHDPLGHLFQSDNYFDHVACADAHQICSDTSGQNCAAWGGNEQFIDSAKNGLSLTSTQEGILDRFSEYSLYSAISDTVGNRGGAALQASETLWQGGAGQSLQVGLPSD